MGKRPTGSGGEPSSPNCGASAGVKARHLQLFGLSKTSTYVVLKASQALLYHLVLFCPLDHPLRAERPTGRIVISLGSSNYREALSKGYAKRAEILTGVIYDPISRFKY